MTEATRGLRHANLAGAAGVVAAIGFYNYLFCFSFVPLTEGWFSAYAQLVLNGQVPYRDFYLYLPPFYPMALASVVSLLGKSFFVLRLAGLLMAIAITLLLYLILTRRFSAPSSALAAIVAGMYYESGVAFIPYDFTQVLTLLTLAVTWQLVQILPEPHGQSVLGLRSPVIRHGALAGLFASLAFLTKQSNGAFIATAAALCCFYLAFQYGRKGWKLIVAYGIGSGLPILILLMWLLYERALGPFWEQIFGGALAAKGNLGHVMFSWISGLLTPVYLTQLMTVTKYASLIILGSLVLRFALKSIDKPMSGSSLDIVLCGGFSTMSILVIALSYAGASSLGGLTPGLGLQLNNYIIPVAITLAAFLVVSAIAGCFYVPLRRFVPVQLAVIGIMSFGMIWGNGTSAGLSEIGVFVMLAIAIAALLDLRSFRYTGFASALVLSAVLLLTFSSKKFESPYAWWGVSEPDVREATYSSELPLARGLHMSEATATTLNALSRSINDDTRGGDIFAFPNIPIAYLIANRWPQSKVVIPWFDFLPDAPARAEARRLLDAPPETIVNMNLPETAWKAHERLFRGGRPLGQRDILSAIKELTVHRKLYQLIFHKEVSPGCVLDVWRKFDQE